MLRLAFKDLFHEKGRLLISLGGVATPLLLVLLLEGMFAGASEQIVAYLEETDAQVWVMQAGVSNMHMATSMVPGRALEEVRKVPGVEDATPILYVNNFVETGEQQWFSYIVGLPSGAPRGGPWRMAEGKAEPGPGEVILPQVLARRSDLSLGDQVIIMGRPFTIAGLSKGTFSMANSIAFLSYEDLAGLLAAPGMASYVLVTARPGVSPEELARRIREQVAGVNALTSEAFADSDRRMARQMGVDVIRMMALVGFGVGVLVVGLAMYTAATSRTREYGVMKAVGARKGYLLRLVSLQTAVVSLAGLALAVALAYGLRPLIEGAVPEVALSYTSDSLVRVAAASLVIAFLAAALPAYRAAQVEPMIAFKE